MRTTALGLPVPPGFVVPADALEVALADAIARMRAVLARAEAGEDAGVVAEEAGALVRASEQQLGSLAGIAVELEAGFGCSQDIEWAIERDEIFVLQSRPVPA